MEFEDHEAEHEEGLTPSYDSLEHSNSTRPNNKMPSPLRVDIPAQRKPRYKECLKNHAVGIGGHAVDGCGEFMAAGEEGTIDALKCAACNCHRNFHRKETDSATASPAGYFNFQPQQPLLTHYPHAPVYRTPSGYLHVTAARAVAPPQPLALPSSSGGGREELEEMWQLNSGIGGGSSSAKKRHRTKFTPEQKEKMTELAERLGWRLQKQDEEAVQQFCNEFGITRQVLKVWMHNNKNTHHGKKP